MYIALAEFDIFSCLSVFSPLTSTSSPTYPLPPPTTLVGALAYPYLRFKEFKEVVEGGCSPAVKLLDDVVYAVAGAEGWCITGGPERSYQLIYQRPERWGVKELAYTISIKGLVTYLDDKLYVVYVSKNIEPLKYIYGIVRIGRKEGHVALRQVVIRKLEEVICGERIFKTIFYTPTNIVLCNDALKVSMPKLSRVNYEQTNKPELEEFYVPRGFGPMTCELKKEGVAVNIDGKFVALPKTLVKGGV